MRYTVYEICVHCYLVSDLLYFKDVFCFVFALNTILVAKIQQWTPQWSVGYIFIYTVYIDMHADPEGFEDFLFGNLKQMSNGIKHSNVCWSV